jgi:UDP-3-O-[3-hydroxymyristoyl] N-acetylglucosamine deacetylase/UDP-3-O-[3-hydroxymyristoyl] N-acetylglucosamine deacetylase/3-hydroxyacyl-[acyl-carrier-protein] dehydratase
MVEHVLAALAGLRIDNCEVHVDRAEMPGCDGSSQAFTTALMNAGRVLQNGKRQQLIVTNQLRVGDEHSWITTSPNSDHRYRLQYDLDYPHAPAIGSQKFTCELTEAAFLADISSARTFVLQSEADELKRQGLGQRVTHQDVLVFDDQGPQDNPLRFENECARHKTLDMIGDFALAGVDLVGDFHACRSGHRLNSQLVFAILSQAVEQTSQQHTLQQSSARSA